MDEGRTEKTRNKQIKAFSFSIDRILKRDDAKEDDFKRNTRMMPCCSSPNCREDETVEAKPLTVCRSYKSAFLACPHPICSIPTNPLVHNDLYHDFHASRSYHKYFGFSPAPHTLYSGEYIKASETFPYNHGLLRLTREPDISMQLRYEEKRSPTNDDRNDSKRKGGQVRFSHVQSVELERIFSLQKYISPQERKQLSRFLQLSERQVKTWFQNRRAKWRRIKMESEMRRRMAHEKATRQRYDIIESTEKSLTYSDKPYTEDRNENA